MVKRKREKTEPKPTVAPASKAEEKPDGRSVPWGHMMTAMLAFVAGVVFPGIRACFPITRSEIVEVVSEDPSQSIDPFEVEVDGGDLVSYFTLTKPFKNVGFLPGRIDDVKPVLVGGVSTPATIEVRYIDRAPIRAREIREVRVVCIIRVPIHQLANAKYASWQLFFYDDSGNEVGWTSYQSVAGPGPIPEEPFPESVREGLREGLPKR